MSAEQLGKRRTRLLIAFFLMTTFLNIIYTRLHFKNRGSSDSYSDSDYTYIGDDFPPSLPIPPLPFITTTIEPSLRFALNSDRSTSSAFVANLPSGIGFVRLGPTHRTFAISMYHELHCLLEIHQTIVQKAGGNKHVQHCLNYLRQGIMCSADTTLEPGDYHRWGNENATSDWEAEAVGDRVCRDWRVAHEYIENNYREWESWRKAWASEGADELVEDHTNGMHLHR